MSDELGSTTSDGGIAETEATAADPRPDLRPDPRDARIAALETEAAELKNQVLRTLADMENLRRRTEREVKDAGQYAIAAFARDVLSVGDNLSRALAAFPAEQRASADPAVVSLVEGVELTERELVKALERHKVRKIEPKGERFDPNFHQAMFEVPNPDIASGTVVEVIQAGYVIGERVLRPALVGIAKGGQKAGKSADGEGASLDRTV
jgi:molecular chaperone GrpE